MRSIVAVLLLSLPLATPHEGAGAVLSQSADPPPLARFVFDSSSSPWAPLELGALVEEREAVIRRVLTVLGDSAPDEAAVDFHAYPSEELKGLATQNGRWAHLDRNTQTLHVVIDGEFRGDRMGLEASLLFWRALGPPALSVLDAGIASFFSTRWGDRGFEYWAARLHSDGTDPIASRRSFRRGGWRTNRRSSFGPWPESSWRISWADGPERDSWIAMHRGGPKLVRFKRWRRVGATSWMRYCAGTRRRSRSTWPRTGSGAWPDSLRFGGSISRTKDKGHRTYDGYLSDRSGESLARLVELGANGVAVLPYAFMSVPDEPVPLRAPTRLGSETDEAIRQAVRAAQEQGLIVLLKPHIWLRGSWPGEIEMRKSAGLEPVLRVLRAVDPPLRHPGRDSRGPCALCGSRALGGDDGPRETVGGAGPSCSAHLFRQCGLRRQLGRRVREPRLLGCL